MLLKKVMIIFILLFGIAGCLPKPDPRVGDFNAVVIDTLTEEPVPGVDVTIGDQPYKTNLKGCFSLAGLAPGEYRVKMERSCYRLKEVSYNHLGKPDLVEFYFQPEVELSGRIIYSQDRSGNRDLFQLNLQSREIDVLNGLPNSDETNPCRAGLEKIAFQSNLGSNSTIHFLNLVSKDIQQIKGCDPGTHPSFDQTGTIMVYKTSTNIITKYDLSTGIKTTYTPPGFYPVINHFGTAVAYVCNNYNSLYINTNGSEDYFTPSGNFEGYRLNNPCWSPDGTKIAFEAYQGAEGPRAIYYIQEPFESAIMQQITFPTGSKEQHHHPTWSGIQEDVIYFAANIVYSSRSDIYAVKIGNGSEWIMVSKGSGSKDYPCWGM